MRKNRELMPKDLKASCNPDMFKITTTKEIDDYSDLVYGQERGIKALNFGIDIDLNGYNMYLEGSAGVGKTMYTHRLLSEKAKEKPIPSDWVYVYNFENPNEPVAISFTAGEGIIFKKPLARVAITIVTINEVSATTIAFQSRLAPSMPILDMALGARPNPITIIIGPITIGGINLLIHFLPKK